MRIKKPTDQSENTKAGKAIADSGALAKKAMQSSEDKFKFMFEHSIVGKSFTLPSGEINVNQAFCTMLGYSQDELQNKSWQDISYPDDIEPTQRALDKIISGEQDSACLHSSTHYCRPRKAYQENLWRTR